MAGPLASTLNRIAQLGDIPGLTAPKTSPAIPSSGSLAASLSNIDSRSAPSTGGSFSIPDSTSRDPWKSIPQTTASQTSLTNQNKDISQSNFDIDLDYQNSKPIDWSAPNIGMSEGRGTPSFGGSGYGDRSGFGTDSVYDEMLDSLPRMGQLDIVERSSQTNTAGMSSLGGDWSNVDALNDYIQRAAEATGVDPNLIKAVMKLESNGEFIISHAGAIGYMQVVPEFWGHLGFDLYDTYENILAGATVLKYYLDENNGDVYEALRGYHGYGYDGFTTDIQYADVVMGNLQQLQSASNSSYGGYVGTGSGWSVMFGGASPRITQEMGLNSWSSQHLNGMYAYGPAYGITGHAGIDVGMTYGSSVYSPTSGVVIRSGGSGYYCDDSGCGPGQGELRIQLDNGDQLIIGHMSSIDIQVGTRINPGMFVGRSGSAGSGAHIHVEYRVRDSSTASGWRVVDPRTALGGQVTATGNNSGNNAGRSNYILGAQNAGFDYAMRAYFGLL